MLYIISSGFVVVLVSEVGFEDGSLLLLLLFKLGKYLSLKKDLTVNLADLRGMR